MVTYFRFLSIPALFLLVSCSSSERQINTAQTFEPHVDSDGNKKFEIAITPLRPVARASGSGRQGQPRGGAGPGSGQGRGAGNRPGGGQAPSIDVEELLVEILEEQGYCREGFEELERIRDAGQIIVHGRCVELATDEEKSRYRTLDIRPLS